MDSIFIEIVKSSPLLGLMLIFWFYQRKDYRDFVVQVQSQNSEREKQYQQTIQDITHELQADVKEIKNHIFNNNK